MSRAHKRIRKGDQVMVISGNYKGHRGEVLQIVGDKVIVRGINIRKKHVKKSQEYPTGGIVEFEQPIHLSNVLFSPAEDKQVKLRCKIEDNKEKQLYYLQDGNEVVYRKVK